MLRHQPVPVIKELVAGPQGIFIRDLLPAVEEELSLADDRPVPVAGKKDGAAVRIPP